MENTETKATEIKPHTEDPTVYVIAGPNGAGKTTFANEFLPDFERLKMNGYRIVLFFLRLPSADMAVARVKANEEI